MLAGQSICPPIATRTADEDLKKTLLVWSRIVCLERDPYWVGLGEE